jgi:hypothetical protein
MYWRRVLSRDTRSFEAPRAGVAKGGADFIFCSFLVYANRCELRTSFLTLLGIDHWFSSEAEE